MELSVIIVNYKVYQYLIPCIESVKAAMQGMDGEIIVVDNEADPIESARIKSLFPMVTMMENADNKGFSKANNQALAICKGAHVLFLNPDTILPNTALSESLNYIHDHPMVGAIGVQMVNAKGAFLPESKRAFPTPLAAFFKLFGIANWFPRSGIFNRYALGNVDENNIHQIDIIAGAFLMARTRLVKSIGGFDEQFFMYGEDIDLSQRLTKLGFQNHYLGKVVIQHFKGASTDKSSRVYLHHFYHSMHLFVNKYYSGNANWLIRQLLHGGILLSKQWSLLKNH